MEPFGLIFAEIFHFKVSHYIYYNINYFDLALSDKLYLINIINYIHGKIFLKDKNLN